MFGFRRKRENSGRSFRDVAEGMISEGVKKRIARESIDIADLEVENLNGKVVLRGVAKTQADADRALKAPATRRVFRASNPRSKSPRKAPLERTALKRLCTR